MTQRGDFAPTVAFSGMDCTPTITSFLMSSNSKTVTVDKIKLESVLNVKTLSQDVADLHLIVHDTL